MYFFYPSGGMYPHIPRGSANDYHYHIINIIIIIIVAFLSTNKIRFLFSQRFIVREIA